MKKKYSNSDEAAELDPTSMMFSLGKSEKRKHLIRLSVMPCEMIEPGILRVALERTAARYPFVLKHGMRFHGIFIPVYRVALYHERLDEERK